MNYIVKSAVCIAAGLGGCILAQAGDYTTIAARNVFGLVPQAPILPPPTPEEPLPKITLDGFMSVFGRPQVLFKAATQKISLGARPVEDSFVLGEGEREDDIKVVHIDMTSETATFLNHGRLQQIPLTDRK